jgi:hypothetical protein
MAEILHYGRDIRTVWPGLVRDMIDQLPPDALGVLRTQYSLGGATSIQNLFNRLDERAYFTAPGLWLSRMQSLMTTLSHLYGSISAVIRAKTWVDTGVLTPRSIHEVPVAPSVVVNTFVSAAAAAPYTAPQAPEVAAAAPPSAVGLLADATDHLELFYNGDYCQITRIPITLTVPEGAKMFGADGFKIVGYVKGRDAAIEKAERLLDKEIEEVGGVESNARCFFKVSGAGGVDIVYPERKVVRSRRRSNPRGSGAKK